MTVIEIVANEYGGHNNQTCNPLMRPFEGYAEIPESVGTPETLENYPYGDITVDYSGEWPVVTSWMPLPKPEHESEAERDPEPTVYDELDAAYREGVDSV